MPEKETTQPACEVSAYSDLWQFFHDEYNLILLESELDEIIHAVDKFKEKFNSDKK